MNCPYCGKVFLQTAAYVYACPACTPQHKNDFHKVKRELRNHPGLSIQGVSDRTGVPVSTILSWVREGYLQLQEKS